MTKQAMQEFEQKLLSLGYKKWTQYLYGSEDYDVSQMIRDWDGEDMYQIIFRFWDFTKYNATYPSPEVKERYECAIDLVIMPCLDGRADLILSSFDGDIIYDVDRIEKFAEDYYKFIMERIK